ncbi:hypothetical protein ACMC56_08770 [Campylobacterota bacterium DY0563]
MLRRIKRNADKALKKGQESLSNAKAGAVVATAGLITGTNSFGAVTYDAATGFAGSIDLDAYYSAIPLVVTVIGVSIATTLGLNMFRKARG